MRLEPIAQTPSKNQATKCSQWFWGNGIYSTIDKQVIDGVDAWVVLIRSKDANKAHTALKQFLDKEQGKQGP